MINSRQFVGGILTLGGIAMFIAGVTASRSVADRLSNFFTGHFTDATVWLLVGGLIAAAAGVFVLWRSGR